MATRGLAAEFAVNLREIVLRIKGQLRRQAGIGDVEDAVEFLLGATRVVAHGLHLVAGLGPGTLQVDTLLTQHALGVTGDADFVPLVHRTDEVVRHATGTQDGRNQCAVGPADLDQGAQLFVEQRANDMLEIATGQQVGQLFRTINIASPGVVADAVEIERHTAARGEGHFAGSDKQAAVGTVMVGEQQAIAIEFLHSIEQALQLGRFIDIRRIAAGGVVHLGQTGATETVLAEVEQQEFGFALIDSQLRRFRLAHVVNRSKGSHHQRQRRDDLLLDPAIFPGGAHRQ